MAYESSVPQFTGTLHTPSSLGSHASSSLGMTDPLSACLVQLNTPVVSVHASGRTWPIAYPMNSTEGRIEATESAKLKLERLTVAIH